MTGRKLSITITGPEGMLEAMATLLREEGYTVVAPGERVRPLAAERAALAALAGVELPYLSLHARLPDNAWHEPAIAELVRRGEFDELERAKAALEAIKRPRKRRSRR